MVQALTPQIKIRKKADQAGVVVATACGIHCLCVPILLALPSISGLVAHLSEPVEKLFLVSSFLLGSFTLFSSYRKKHHRPECLTIFCGGLLLMIFRDHISFGGPEWLAGLTGGLMVAGAHLRNLHLCRNPYCCGGEDCKGDHV